MTIKNVQTTTNTLGPDMQVIEKLIWSQVIRTIVESKYCSFFYQLQIQTDEWRS